jgi:hypothetical protein
MLTNYRLRKSLGKNRDRNQSGTYCNHESGSTFWVRVDETDTAINELKYKALFLRRKWHANIDIPFVVIQQYVHDRCIWKINSVIYKTTCFKEKRYQKMYGRAQTTSEVSFPKRY